jgi:hypothetical protein
MRLKVDAAGQICGAGFEAARLRQAEAVIAAVGPEISREVEQGIECGFDGCELKDHSRQSGLLTRKIHFRFESTGSRAEDLYSRHVALKTFLNLT